jgi:hypothetical protein
MVVAAFVYDSDPLQTKICHCEDCQRLHGELKSHKSQPLPGCSISGDLGSRWVNVLILV